MNENRQFSDMNSLRDDSKLLLHINFFLWIFFKFFLTKKLMQQIKTEKKTKKILQIKWNSVF